MNDLGQIEGYEMPPAWYYEDLEAQEFEKYLVEIGYYREETM